MFSFLFVSKLDQPNQTFYALQSVSLTGLAGWAEKISDFFWSFLAPYSGSCTKIFSPSPSILQNVHMFCVFVDFIIKQKVWIILDSNQISVKSVFGYLDGEEMVVFDSAPDELYRVVNALPEGLKQMDSSKAL